MAKGHSLAVRERLYDAVAFGLWDIGRKLVALREAANLTQAEVARRAGMRQESLSRLEHGHGNPTLLTLRRIIKAMGYRPSEV